MTQTQTTETPVEHVVAHVANTLYRKYARWVDREDVVSHQWEWIYGIDAAPLARLRKNDNRLYRTLFSLAKVYCENEKAQKTGYSVADLTWYTPAILYDLVEMASDRGFDKIDAEGADVAFENGNLLAMVLDTRAAIGAVGPAPTDDDTSVEYGAWLEKLANRLGGSFPQAPGYDRRRPTGLAGLVEDDE